MEIINIQPRYYENCLRIYNYYIENTTVTLEIKPHSPESFSKRIEGIRAIYPYLVAIENDRVLGYAYLDPFGTREGYRYTADVAIYLDKDFRGKGIGKELMREVLIRGKQQGLRDVIAVVTTENETSLRFHKSFGFIPVGRMEGIADKFDRRFGVVYLQYNLS